MATIINKVNHQSGIALGGIGTGSVELLPDGDFHFWQIANPTRWTSVSGGEEVDDGESCTGCLEFYIRAEFPDGKIQFRKLSQFIDTTKFTYPMFAWNRPFDSIIFEGKFPCATLTYNDEDFPINISMKATAPFVPHNSKLTATPGFYLDFNIENPCDENVKISLLGCLQPEFMAEKSTKNSLVKDNKTTTIFMQSEKENNSVNCGNIAFSLTSDNAQSYIVADFSNYMYEYCAWTKTLGVSQESALIQYRENGVLPNTNSGIRPNSIPKDLSPLSDCELDEIIENVNQLASNKAISERVRHTMPNYPQNREEKLEYLEWLRFQENRKGDSFGACALSSECTLKPNQSTTAHFVLSWYFPNHYKINVEKKENDKSTFNIDYSTRLCHYYENLFANALEVNRTMVEKYNKIAIPAQKFSKLIYSTNLPEIWADSWSVQLSTLVKDSWYLKDGKFALWEGLGSCGFHTTDITYHASFGLAVLFPELQKSQMRMGAKFQREDGRVHHFFTPDLEHVDDGFDRVDMNPQFVLMVCRDWLFTGDKNYVADLWKNVVNAMNATQKLDADGDGLPDTDTKRNTYDAWNFAGVSTYISSLWLASLRAAVILANVMGDTAKADEWEKLRQKALRSFEEKLFNGKYYNLWVDKDKVNECLMTDQLDGEWFLRSAGIEANLSDERVKDVLSYIFENNFVEENGLINATFPKDKHTDVFTYKNCQAEAIWTGIGYAFSALCLRVGLTSIAEEAVNAIHRAQMKLGYFWNHFECGYRYTRPLSSWTTLTALSGQRMNYSEKKIWLNPCNDNLTIPIITADGCALATFSKNKCTLEVVEGTFDGWNIILPNGITVEIK